jgi:hypothetical protein
MPTGACETRPASCREIREPSRLREGGKRRFVRTKCPWLLDNPEIEPPPPIGGVVNRSIFIHGPRTSADCMRFYIRTIHLSFIQHELWFEFQLPAFPRMNPVHRNHESFVTTPVSHELSNTSSTLSPHSPNPMNIKKTILAAGVALAAFSSQKASAFNCPQNVLPTAGSYRIEVIFNTLEAATVFLTQPDGSSIMIADKGVTAHYNHKASFATLRCDSTYLTGAKKLELSVLTKYEGTTLFKLNTTPGASNYFEQVTHTDAHDKNPVIEWRIYDKNSSNSRPRDVIVRFHKWTHPKTIPYGVTAFENRVGHTNFSDTAHFEKKLMVHSSQKNPYRVVQGVFNQPSTNTTSLRRKDTVVVTDNRDPSLKYGYQPILEAPAGSLHRTVVAEAHATQILDDANQARMASASNLTTMGNPDEYLQTKNQLLIALGGGALIDHLDEGIDIMRKHVSSSAFVEPKISGFFAEFSRNVVKNEARTSEASRNLLTTAEGFKVMDSTTVSASITAQIAVEGIEAPFFLTAYTGVKAIEPKLVWHLADRTKTFGTDLQPLETSFDKSANSDHIFTTAVKMKGPTAEVSFIGQAGIDLIMKAVWRLSVDGRSYRIELASADAMLEAETQTWLSNLIGKAFNFLRSPVKGTPVAELPFNSSGASLNGKFRLPDYFDCGIKANEFYQRIKGDYNSAYWTANKYSNPLTQSITEIRNRQASMSNIDRFAVELSVLKFNIPNGKIKDDPTHDKTTGFGGFEFVGISYEPGMTIKQKLGKQYALGAGFDAKFEFIAAAGVELRLCSNSEVRDLMKNNWELD